MKKVGLTTIVLLLLVHFLAAQTISSHEMQQGTLFLTTETGIISLTPYAPHLLRISLSPDGRVIDSDGVIAQAQKGIRFDISENDSALFIETDSLKLKIDKRPFQLTFYDHNQKKVAKQLSFFHREGVSGFQMELNKRELFFGGGERAIPINRRGYRFRLNNEPHWGYGWGEENLNFSVPHLVSSEGYSLYFDQGAIGYADIGKTDSSRIEMASAGKNISYFFICNSSQKGLHQSFARLVGVQPMPPRWAFGNLMSRFGYQTENEAREKLDSMLLAGYPVDAIILDLYWFGLGPADWKMGHLDWYHPNWPKPETMVSDFLGKGVKTILITEPYLLESSENFAEADSLGFFAFDSTGKTNIVEDFFFGRAGLIDLFNQKACDWFWKFYKKQTDIGVAGWWGDLGEPEKFHDDLLFKSGKGPEVRNLYGHFWSKMLAEKYAQVYPEKRLFHLNRAGFAGSQRYSSFPWSGDVSRTWGGFRAQLPNMLSMSLSNIPYAHSDLGGFCVAEKNEELYLRWLQFGVFNPVFRPHSEKVPSEPIYYSDSIQKWLRPFFELRYQLLPYNYTLAWKQEQFGEPLASPLFIHNNLPKTLWSIDDEYMWGETFLVAPVLEAGEKTKAIFLPKGIWFDFFTGKRYLGNGTIRKTIDYQTIPVFVKAGSFVPMTRPMSSTAFYRPDTLEVHFYYDPTVDRANYTLYDDDGSERNAFSNKHYETIRFDFSTNGKEMIFDLLNEGFDYNGRAESRTIVLVIHQFSKREPIRREWIVLPKNSRQKVSISLN